jgi:hypothetical protein
MEKVVSMMCTCVLPKEDLYADVNCIHSLSTPWTHINHLKIYLCLIFHWLSHVEQKYITILTGMGIHIINVHGGLEVGDIKDL